MSTTIKRKRKTGIVLRSRTVATNRAEFSRTTTEVWEGPIPELETKQNAVANTADTTSLATTEGGNGSLTISTSLPLPAPSNYPGTNEHQITIEVEWIELRKKLEEHPFFETVSDADRRKIAEAIANPNPSQSPALTETKAIALYTKLLRGQTEYSIAVPVVRRTNTRPSNLTAGNAWHRDNPPISIPGGWVFMKTANRISQTGRSFNRVEEWTGAKEIDEDIYPAS